MMAYENRPSQPPVPPFASTAPTPPLDVGVFNRLRAEYERRLAALEKRLQEERERVLAAQVRSQTEQANAAKVEIGLKEIQDKLRREKRDQEQEEMRLRLEKQVQDLGAKLAQERETWAEALRSQLADRNALEREIEARSASRLQELEKRWQTEREQWRKDAETEISLRRKEAEQAQAELGRLRAICGALERQAGSARSQLDAMRRAAADWSHAQERSRTELAALQERWAEKERDIRAEAEAKGAQALEAEKSRLRAQAQEELNRRVEAIVEELRREAVSERKLLETQARSGFEREYAAALARAEEFERRAVDLERALQAQKAEFERLLVERERLAREEAEFLGREAESARCERDEALRAARESAARAAQQNSGS